MLFDADPVLVVVAAANCKEKGEEQKVCEICCEFCHCSAVFSGVDSLSLFGSLLFLQNVPSCQLSCYDVLVVLLNQRKKESVEKRICFA